MNTLSELGRAITSSSVGHFLPVDGHHSASSREQRAPLRHQLVNVVVAARDALLVRRTLLGCVDAAIERCVPMRREDKVKLEIHFAAGHGDEVIRRIIGSIPEGEFGCIIACAGPAPHGAAAQGEGHGH